MESDKSYLHKDNNYQLNNQYSYNQYWNKINENVGGILTTFMAKSINRITLWYAFKS